MLPKGKPASKLPYAKGKYIPRKGRIIYIDPLSDGVMSLPLKVQEFSLQRYAQDNELKAAFAEATKDVKELTSLKRYKLPLSLKESFPDVPKILIFQACGLDPSKDKELAEAMNRPNLYATVRPIIVELYKACNGKAVRITIVQRLHKFGIENYFKLNFAQNMGKSCSDV